MYHNSVHRNFNPFLQTTGLNPQHIIEGSQRESIGTTHLTTVNLDVWANSLPTGTEIPFDTYYALPEHLRNLFNRVDQGDEQWETDYHYFKKPSASEVALDFQQRNLALETFVRSLPTGSELESSKYYALPEHLKSLFKAVDQSDCQWDTDYHYFKKPSDREVEHSKLALETFVRSLPTGTELESSKYYSLPEHLTSLFKAVDQSDCQWEQDYHYFKK